MEELNRSPCLLVSPAFVLTQSGSLYYGLPTYGVQTPSSTVLFCVCPVTSSFPAVLSYCPPVTSCTDEAAQSEVASSFKVCYTVSAKHWSHIIFEVSIWSAFCQIWPALCSHLMLGNFSSILICSCHSLKRYIVSSEHGLQTLWPPWHGIQGP